MTEPTIDEVEPVLCEHGRAEGHFYKSSARYGAFCPGPTCVHGQSASHYKTVISEVCPGPVSVPKESSE